jgi:hypothetical protein
MVSKYHPGEELLEKACQVLFNLGTVAVDVNAVSLYN